MRELCPLITPRKKKNIKTKHEKTNTTRRKRPPCLSFLNVSIRNPDYRGEAAPLSPPKGKKQTVYGAKNQKIKDGIQRKRLLRKKTDDLRCKIKRLKEKQKMQQDYWERKYISPSTKGKAFPLVNPLLFISTMTPCPSPRRLSSRGPKL